MMGKMVLRFGGGVFYTGLETGQLRLIDPLAPATSPPNRVTTQLHTLSLHVPQQDACRT